MVPLGPSGLIIEQAPDAQAQSNIHLYFYPYKSPLWKEDHNSILVSQEVIIRANVQ